VIASQHFCVPICIPKRRIAFVDINGLPITGNTHASALIYVGIMSALLSRISVNLVLSEVKSGNLIQISHSPAMGTRQALCDDVKVKVGHNRPIFPMCAIHEGHKSSTIYTHCNRNTYDDYAHEKRKD